MRITASRIILIVTLCLGLGPGAAAQTAGDEPKTSPPPFPDFTFKRIRPPSAESERLITVQIAPVAPIARIPARANAAAPGLDDPQVAEFWAKVDPSLASASPGRLSRAAGAVADLELPGPSLNGLQAIASTHGRAILAASVEAEVSPALVLAVIAVESAGRESAVSRAGAQGLMQLIPATAARFDVSDAFDPGQNITGGVRYLSWLLDEFDGDPVLALAGYNAGENAVKDAGGVPSFAETRAYVPMVVSAWSVARGLCMTPPDLASDGCVFASLAVN